MFARLPGALSSTSPTDAVSLGFLAVLTSLFLSGAQRWGFEARCPEGTSPGTTKTHWDPALQENGARDLTGPFKAPNTRPPLPAGGKRVLGSLLPLT